MIVWAASCISELRAKRHTPYLVANDIQLLSARQPMSYISMLSRKKPIGGQCIRCMLLMSLFATLTFLFLTLLELVMVQQFSAFSRNKPDRNTLEIYACFANLFCRVIPLVQAKSCVHDNGHGQKGGSVLKDS